MPIPAWICDLGCAEYEETARLQRSLRAAREVGAIPDTLLMLEHEPVITTGHRTEMHEVAHALTSDIPVVPTERGGKATYHGPGQLVAYPILDLRRHGQDIRAYVRALEQAVIDTLDAVGISAVRRSGLPGVWVVDDAGARKIASLGVRVTRWVSFHGLALNVDCDLEPFSWFTPCGIGDVAMTSIAAELKHRAPSRDEVRALLAGNLQASLGLTCSSIARERVEELAGHHRVAAPQLAPVGERVARVARAEQVL